MFRYYRGRGAFESLGSGLEMDDGDVGFKCNFAFVHPSTGIVEKRRADRKFESIGPILCQDLHGEGRPVNLSFPDDRSLLTALPIEGFPEVQLRVRYATEHRCGIVLHGSGLTDNITGTDPLRDGCPLGTATALDASPEVTSCGW